MKRNTGYSSTMRSVVLNGVNGLGAQSRVSVYIIYDGSNISLSALQIKKAPLVVPLI